MSAVERLARLTGEDRAVAEGIVAAVLDPAPRVGRLSPSLSQIVLIIHAARGRVVSGDVLLTLHEIRTGREVGAMALGKLLGKIKAREPAIRAAIVCATRRGWWWASDASPHELVRAA